MVGCVWVFLLLWFSILKENRFFFGILQPKTVHGRRRPWSSVWFGARGETGLD